MSVPGAFAMRNKQTHRAPTNPMDKATVVSIYPQRILEKKATIQPGVFEIEPGSFEKPSILVVGGSSWWREIDEDQPLLEIPIGALTIADSIVNDYCNGLHGYAAGVTQPGLFCLPGEWTVVKIKAEQMAMLTKYNEMQRNWYLELIKFADVGWARTNGNPLAVSDIARLACKELGIKNKPWMGDIQAAELVQCVACGNLRNPRFPICPHCKAIVDTTRAKELNLSFAQ